MKMSFLYSLTLLIIVNIGLFAVSQDVPHIRTNKNVHYDKERAVFECVLTRPNLVIWYLNGVSPPNEPAEFMATISTSYTSDKVMSNLTMDASPETNNTRIVCQAYVGRLGVVYNSPAVVLSVQGVLSRPGVTLVNDSQSVNITLDKPYCLPGAQISHYGSEVYVPNQKTILTNFTNPEISFIFSEHNISRCDSQYINISLCAYNLAGEGEFSYVEVFVPSDTNYCDQLPMSGPKDVDSSLIYLLAAVLVASVILVLVCACIFVKRTSTDQVTKSSGVSMNNNHIVVDIGCDKMTQNTSYAATIPMKQNKAYEDTPHIYDEVKNLPCYNPAEA